MTRNNILKVIKKHGFNPMTPYYIEKIYIIFATDDAGKNWEIRVNTLTKIATIEKISKLLWYERVDISEWFKEVVI